MTTDIPTMKNISNDHRAQTVKNISNDHRHTNTEEHNEHRHTYAI